MRASYVLGYLAFLHSLVCRVHIYCRNDWQVRSLLVRESTLASHLQPGLIQLAFSFSSVTLGVLLLRLVIEV